jgi:glycosyltransferase involved in cell wall biosynthesis
VSAPAVSLIVTTYNHERYVDDALQSVSRQTFRDFEIVVLDDCSTDGSVARVERWLPHAPVPVTFLRNERNLGICASRNRSTSHCRGEFVCALAADDFYEPDKIERQYEFFTTLGPEVAAVFTDMYVVVELGAPMHRWFDDRPPVEGDIFRALLPGNFIPAPTVMTRRSALLDVGPYDESLTVEDYDMWLRLSDRYEFRYLPAALVSYRILATSLSRAPRWEVDRLESRVHALLKWHAKPGDGDVAVDMAWRYARRAFALHRQRGLVLLAEVAACRPDVGRRLVVEAARMPGAQRAARAAFGVVDGAERARRRA